MTRAVGIVVAIAAVAALVTWLQRHPQPEQRASVTQNASPLTEHPADEPSAASLVALVNSSAPEGDVFSGQFCGGVLVSPNQVLTVEHCLRDTPAWAVDVIVGAGNLCAGAPITGQRLHVRSIRHATGGPGASDIATLELADAATATPAQVSTERELRGDLLAQGWGQRSLASASRCTPRSVPVTAGPRTECANALRVATSRPTRDVWCGIGATETNVCVGDSGGPLYSRLSPDVVVGLVSWGVRDCSPATPKFFSRVHPR